MIRDNILHRIDQLCAKKNWSFYELTVESGLSSGMIYQWFNGNRNPSLLSLECICKAFDISLCEFFAFSEQEKSDTLVAKLCAVAQQLSDEEVENVIRLLESLKKTSK